MRKVKVLTTLLFIAFICSGCPDKCEHCHQYITFINKSNEEILCLFYFVDIDKKGDSSCVIYWDAP
jgi:hypothetical protein